MAIPTNSATASLAGMIQNPPLYRPSGLFAAVAAMSTIVTASAQATEWRTGNLVAIVTRPTAGSSSATPFTYPRRL